MLRAKDITYSYGLGLVFDQASLFVGKGVKAGLVGPNGAGKSTLLKLLTREYPLQAGNITREGSIGYVPQEIKTDPILEQAKSIRDYIDPTYSKDDAELLEMLRGVELSTLSLYSKPQTLSGGQKTKI